MYSARPASRLIRNFDAAWACSSTVMRVIRSQYGTRREQRTDFEVSFVDIVSLRGHGLCDAINKHLTDGGDNRYSCYVSLYCLSFVLRMIA